ncbi:hypothetical protein C1J03_00195 [Sulfitobacter sp. SK012]|uniref:FkbM family methyltransferase n=1 Tax=Sulfitobacter sp. SK012 TaxID=1389005 RepID=UPI000E09EF2A|nr:FkbM family methyltransferase [Sulfitobacter sp. SK012]AXI44584.1 hypothetical protein C1J03_00195 [Sulfitobacter sp. SK012]
MNAPLAENKYGVYSLPSKLNHRPAVRLIKQGYVYEPKTIRFMMENAGDGDIIHAGTFFGDFLPGLAGAMSPKGKIWAFEPNPDSFEHAKRTIKLNKLKNVTIQNHALSNTSGELLFRTHDKNGQPMGGHSTVVHEFGDGIQRVSAVSLDDMIPANRKISILQLDVEGHERAALIGAEKIINRCKPILILEDFKRPRFIRLNFGHLGYKLIGKLHGNRIFSTEPVAFWKDNQPQS